MARRKSRESGADDFEENARGLNLVVLQGQLSSDPVTRELPSGEKVLNLEVTTPTGLGRLSVPVVTDPVKLDLHAGREVVVVGHVRRRFFRAGTGVQSRTEVVAETILLSSQVARIRRAFDDAVDYLATPRT